MFRKISLSLMVFAALPIGCASTKAVDKAMADAKSAYSRFQAENPSQEATAQYRMYYARAESAKNSGSNSTAIDMAKLAQQEAETALKKRHQLAQELKKKMGWFQYELEKILYPSQDILDTYFQALDAFKEKSYEKVQALYEEGTKRLDLEKATSFQDTVVLRTPPALVQTYKGRIRVYSYIGQDHQLHDIKGEIPEGTQVKFLEKRYIKKDFAFYHVRTKNGALEGWVYPQFVSR